MLLFEQEILKSAEHLARTGFTDNALKEVRRLGLDAWGDLLWSMPSHDFPSLSRLLPRMVSDQIQIDWTGASGKVLLNQTIPFVRYALSVSNLDMENSPADLKLLDYGCGYGRIARLMLKYIEIEKIFGCDPWPESLNLITTSGFSSNFKLTQEVPDILPFQTYSFDLIWAFSVFTHLSPDVTRLSLKTISKYLKPKGVLIITIRPVEYWDMRTDLSDAITAAMKTDHLRDGSAFFPHNRQVVGAHGVIYGDTTISLESLGSTLPGYQIVDVDRSDTDPYQVYVTLKNKY